MKHTLQPIEPPYAPDIARIFASYPQDKDGYILRLFRVFANSMRFLTGKGVANLLDRDSPLTLREREIVILRVTANTRCEYEWGVHVTAFAQAAALSAEQIAATASFDSQQNAQIDCWTTREQLLLRCVDDICQHARISTANYAQFQLCWDLPQQLEILALCGNYHLVSFVANTARIELEDSAARFPTG